jgi:hypothetical protein
MLKSVEKELWLAALLIGLLGWLLFRVVSDFGVGLPDFPPPTQPAPAPPPRLARLQLEGLFAPGAAWPRATATNLVSPFHTTHFQPAPVKPPTTRKVELTYLGFLRGSVGPLQAFVQVGETNFIGPVGSQVLADLRVVEIAPEALLLRNSAAQTNRLEFNRRQSIEIPVP